MSALKVVGNLTFGTMCLYIPIISSGLESIGVTLPVLIVNDVMDIQNVQYAWIR